MRQREAKVGTFVRVRENVLNNLDEINISEDRWYVRKIGKVGKIVEVTSFGKTVGSTTATVQFGRNKKLYVFFLNELDFVGR